jgi:hypothetical protein
MERVRLRLVLDDPDRPRRPGEALSGRVEVECDEAVACGGLRMEAGWETSGAANEASGTPVEETIPTGPWEAGERRSYPFALTLPEGVPPTYDGSNFALAWKVRASADIAWARDPSAEASFEVLPASPGDGTLTAKEDTGCFEVGCAWTCAALVLGGAALLLALDPRDEKAFLGWAGVVIVFLISLYAVPKALAVRRIGPASLEAGPVPAARGGELAVSLTLRPRRDMVLGPVRAALTATEESSKGSGKQRKTLKEEVARATADLEGPERLHAGREAVFAGMLVVPADAPPSFEAEPHKVAWELKFSAEVPGLPDVDWEVEVRVA